MSSKPINTSIFTNAEFAYHVSSTAILTPEEIEKLCWLLGAELDRREVTGLSIAGPFIGPRPELVSPWSTNATQIARNVGLETVTRIEEFARATDGASFDPMLQRRFETLEHSTLTVNQEPRPTRQVENLEEFNKLEGLALSEDELHFLKGKAQELGRPFTDCEIFAFAQINSEHCRHKIFNGQFVIDDVPQEKSLFQMIKDTSRNAPGEIVSAYKDNVAFVKGCTIKHFAPQSPESSTAGGTPHFTYPQRYTHRAIDAVLSLKAETHNFPTTVEPFYGASTGSGGEIRDRMAGGRGSQPLAGTAVYMASSPRLPYSKHLGENLGVTTDIAPRPWKYQTPQEILTKASNGASDFGNKFGQPLIAGSTLVFEGVAEIRRAPTSGGSPVEPQVESQVEIRPATEKQLYAYDRAVMLAGGVGFADATQAIKGHAAVGDIVVLLGGDNYRIGMGGGSVSSVNTGVYSSSLELSAVQRANPEMQKRVYNAIRIFTELSSNPIKLIHDHGAGGHVNCFSELVEESGGKFEIAKLPIGDPTLSMLEIICNESQERMGLIISEEDWPLLQEVAAREHAPAYAVGKITGDKQLVFEAPDGSLPLDIPLDVLFGSSPRLVLQDTSDTVLAFPVYAPSIKTPDELKATLLKVLATETVGCKDWLTNKVDRCVTGRVALQQCTGPKHLPLNDAGVMALDYQGLHGMATSIGHAPIVGLLDAKAGAILSVAEAITNLAMIPLERGLKSIALSANWMWPANQPGENARLYRAVEALSDFCISLGVAVPTGKDSLSMTMSYSDGTSASKSVRAPGTVIVSAGGLVSDIKKCISAELKSPSQVGENVGENVGEDGAGDSREDTVLVYVDFTGDDNSPLGGSMLAQINQAIGGEYPQIADCSHFTKCFSVLQELLSAQAIVAGHDVSSGGLIATVAEMAMVGDTGVSLSVPEAKCTAAEEWLFCEKPGVVIQVRRAQVADVIERFAKCGISAPVIGEVTAGNADIKHFTLSAGSLSFDIPLRELLASWLEPSAQMEVFQAAPAIAAERRASLLDERITYRLPNAFTGLKSDLGITSAEAGAAEPQRVFKAAVIREQGSNGEREMAIALHLAGFDVIDATMSDITAGHVTLEDVSFAIFPGGFANSDVMGAGRGWAGVFRFNTRAKAALEQFYRRKDTLSLGVCNGCQLMVALNLLYPEHEVAPAMRHNTSGKFESIFVPVDVTDSPSVLLKPLVGSRLGIWIAHGEGHFNLPLERSRYNIPLSYAIDSYPFNPNGSPYNTAAIVSDDGRHLAMMPHLERSIFPWQWPYKGEDGKVNSWEVSPWLSCFVAARKWLENSSAKEGA